MSNALVDEVSPLSHHDLLAGRDQMLAQMKWIRGYSLQLIDSVPEKFWYTMPASAPTNVAWQVGHLAVAQYGLMLFRQRGRLAGDLEIMPGWLRKQFGKSSQPSEIDPQISSPNQLRELLTRIHDRACQEVAQLTAATLCEPTDMPYAGYPTKLGALLFCPLHESIHAGQIGVLRRLHGLEPLR